MTYRTGLLAAGCLMADALRVLVVEDEASVRDALRMILEDEGFTVVSASRGAEGVGLLRATGFDLTITDLRLPDMSGLDVLSAVRFARGRAILITAHATQEVCAEARLRGAFGVLRKPFPPSDILRLVADALKAV